MALDEFFRPVQARRRVRADRAMVEEAFDVVGQRAG